ncbi:MAG: hypothetical protein MUC50_22680 [Myxococcota bacterium]|nr:hypothetical protein [Myxococcota bacterium]
MRHTISVIALMFAAAAVLGCRSQEEKVEGSAGDLEPAAAHLDKAKKESKEAFRATRDYAFQQRAEFVEKMKNDLLEIEKDLRQLAAKVKNTSGPAKADARKKLAAAQEKWAVAKQRLEMAQRATEASWEDVKARCEASFVDLKSSVEQAHQRLKLKVER